MIAQHATSSFIMALSLSFHFDFFSEGTEALSPCVLKQESDGGA